MHNSTMKFVYLLYGTALLVACPLAVADTFQIEGGLSYTEADTDFSERDATLIEGTYFLKPVDTDDVPWSEAAFLARAGSMSVSFERNNLEPVILTASSATFTFTPILTPDVLDDAIFGVGDTPFTTITFANGNGFPVLPPGSTAILPSSGSNEDDVLSLAAEYVNAEGWIIGGRYARSSGDEALVEGAFFSSASDREVDFLSVKFGRFFGRTSVSFIYSNQKNESSSSRTNNITLSPTLGTTTFQNMSEFEASEDTYELTSKTIVSRWGFNHKLEAAVGYALSDSSVDATRIVTSTLNPSPMTTGFSVGDQTYEKQWRVGYAFYPRNNLELGVTYASVDEEFDDRSLFDLSVEWFVNRRIAVNARYFSLDRSVFDEDGLAIGIVGRY